MSEEKRNPFEEVCRMLDERGIDYTVDDSDDYEVIEWSSAYNLWWQFVYDPYEEMPYGELRLLEAGGSTHLTPEQAVSVTVGNSTDLSKRLREVHGLHEFAELFGFDWTGESDWDWHDVACAMADAVDAATVGAGTCKDLGGTGANGEDVFNCSECGCVLSLYDGEGVNTLCTSFIYDYPRFCPECGARVVSE